MCRVKRLKYPLAAVAVAVLVLAPMTAAAATPTPNPSLDTILAKPPSTDFNELTTSALNGAFTAHDWATLNGSGSAATDTENALNHDGFVAGYGKTWAQVSSGHALIEAVMAFNGGQGARKALTGLEAGDKSDPAYKHSVTVSGIDPYYGAHFVDSSNNVVEDLFAFAKGNDVFGVLFVSDKDDVATLAVTQAKAQFAAAPESTIPSSQWPENTSPASSFPVAAFAIAVAFVIVVVGLIAFLALRRRSAPAMAGAYGMPAAYGTPGAPDAMGAPGAIDAQGAPAGAVQMSPDGNYWWDGQAWKDAAHEAPPAAQRSGDGTLWWDGANWRPVPQAAAEQPPAS